MVADEIMRLLLPPCGILNTLFARSIVKKQQKTDIHHKNQSF